MNDDQVSDDDVDSRVVGLASEAQSLPEEILELDHVYEALASPRRQYLCYTLLEEPTWTLTDLARKIAAWETESSEEAVSAADRERVYVSLFHAHVPKLVDDGIISFNEANETIQAAENASEVLVALNGMGATLESYLEAHARGDHDDVGR